MPAFSRQDSFARGLISVSLPRSEEGAGKTGCQPHPQPRPPFSVRAGNKGNATGQPSTRPSPRNDLTAYGALSWVRYSLDTLSAGFGVTRPSGWMNQASGHRDAPIQRHQDHALLPDADTFALSLRRFLQPAKAFRRRCVRSIGLPRRRRGSRVPPCLPSLARAKLAASSSHPVPRREAGAAPLIGIGHCLSSR